MRHCIAIGALAAALLATGALSAKDLESGPQVGDSSSITPFHPLNVTGESVRRGQPVALIYSPDVFTAGEEYRLALENRQRLNNSKQPEAISEADALVSASRRTWPSFPPLP